MPRRKRRLASRVRDCVRRLLAFLFSNVGVVVLVVAYTIAGAFMFQAIEGASEIERGTHMARERDNTAEYLWRNVTLALNLFNETALKSRISIELQQYQRKVVVAARRGWDGGRSSRQWSFSSAFLYSLTVITTIGYGHLSPRTSWGKITTIFYALLGMPLFLLYLTNVGELLARWFKCLYALVCLCRGCPGFTRRRVVRMPIQIEISDAESIERPKGWRIRCSDSDVTPDQRNPADYRCSPRYRPYRLPPDRFLSQRLPPDRYLQQRLPQDRCLPQRLPPDRYAPQRLPLDEFPSHRITPDKFLPQRLPPDRYYPPQRLPPDRCPPQRLPLDIDPPRRLQLDEFSPHRIIPDRFLPHRLQPDRYTLHRIPPDSIPQYRLPIDRFPQERYSTHPNRHFQRRPDYFRSTSMPQPWESSRGRDPRLRGWSEPYGYRSGESQDTSEFSYVTFDAQTITVPISVCVAIMVGYLMFGSMIFGMWEKWDQLDGAYFCFISLSSIGFGDFVPGERVYTPRIETSFIVCSMYLMLGMALVAMCFNLMQEQVIHYVAGLKRAARRACRCGR